MLVDQNQVMSLTIIGIGAPGLGLGE